MTQGSSAPPASAPGAAGSGAHEGTAAHPVEPVHDERAAAHPVEPVHDERAVAHLVESVHDESPHSHGHEPPSHEHDHSHGHEPPSHEHDHSHGHEHDHSHRHEPPSHEHDHSHGHEPPSHEHDHSHWHEPPSHGHEHDHSHSHDFALQVLPGDAEQHREPLAAGAGLGKHLLLDTQSGIAGDMLIAALIDLGVPLAVVTSAVRALKLTGFQLTLRPVLVGALGAAQLDVVVTHPQPPRSYAQIAQLLADSALSASVKERAQRTFRLLAEAESKAHRVAVDDVHFHEVGAVDSIVDIVGACACLDYLGATVWVTPLPLGRGFVRCQHGRIPLPAPATLDCLRGFHTIDAGTEGELVTPTGAALVGAMARPSPSWLSGVPLCSGWGAGHRELSDRPNALRAVLIERDEEPHAVELIEANVDDLTGELAGHALSALLTAGALDAWITPVTMKKGRPGWVLSALARPDAALTVAEALLRETTTLGVRRHRATRIERPRHVELVQTRYGEVRVKISEGPFGAPIVKPEFDDCQRLAEAAGVSTREVLSEALGLARAQRAPQSQLP